MSGLKYTQQPNTKFDTLPYKGSVKVVLRSPFLSALPQQASNGKSCDLCASEGCKRTAYYKDIGSNIVVSVISNIY